MSKDYTILDSNESAFFLRELEYVKVKSYDTKYKKLKYMDLFPISTEADPGAASITYQRYTKVGIGRIISDYADDAPRADVYGTEVTTKVYRVGTSYGYSRDEIRRSQMVGKSLDQRRANSAKRASDEKINSIAFSGDTSHSISGFISYPGITEYTITNGAAASKLWSTKTPDEIIFDMSSLVNAVVNTTNGVEAPDTMLMDLTHYNLIANTRMTGNSDKTILSFFLENNPFINTIEWLTELTTAGAGSTSRIMVYPKNPDTLTLEMPLPYAQLPPEQKNYGFKVLTEQKTAGVIVYFPLAISYGDGI